MRRHVASELPHKRRKFDTRPVLSDEEDGEHVLADHVTYGHMQMLSANRVEGKTKEKVHF